MLFTLRDVEQHTANGQLLFLIISQIFKLEGFCFL